MKGSGGLGEMAQKACLLEGLTQLLAVTPGDFAVLLHSDPDCANLVWRDFRAADPTRFFCTNLTEADVLSGGTSAILEQAIGDVATLADPAAIVVIGSCVSSMLADDVTAVTRGMGPRVRPRLFPVQMDAFRLYGQAHVLDEFTWLVWQMSGRDRPRSGLSVNMLGFVPDRGETRRILGALGVTVSAAPAVSDPPDVWGRLASGSLNVVSDARLYARLLDDMKKRLGVGHVEIAPPYGLAATTGLLDGIARELGVAAAPGGPIAMAAAHAREALDRAVARLSGSKLGYHVAGRKDFSLDVIVREGLALVDMFAEMGFEVHLLVQGAVAGRSMAATMATLDRYGIDLPLTPLADRVSMTRAIGDLGLCAVYCSDSLREEVGRAGVPLFAIGSMETGFEGLARNVDRITGLLMPGRGVA